MLYTPPTTPRPIEVPIEARPLLQVLPAGRVLHATARRDDSGQMMAIAGRLRLPLPAGAGLSPGDTLVLRVTADAAGRPGIEILPAPDRGTDALTRLQRIHLPRQQPVTQTVRQLAGLAPGELPQPAARALQSVLASLVTPQQLGSADGLRTALRDSGALFETRLAARPELASAITQGDLRAQLLRLAAALRGSHSGSDRRGTATAHEAMGRTAQHTEQAITGALARQMLQQLAAHRNDGQVSLNFELPVAHGDAVDALHVSFREEPSGEGDDGNPAGGETEDDARWRVDVRLEFAGIGELEARLFFDARGLAITWRADNEALRATLATETPRLADALAQAGLDVQGLSVSERPPEAESAEISASMEGLIDARA